MIPRLILDTNVLVGSAYNPASASRRLVDACRAGRCRMVLSEAIRAEYKRMLPRAVRKPAELDALLELIGAAEVVTPGLTPRVVREDPEDDKFFAAAWAGKVDAIVTNDQQLLEVNGTEGVCVARPSEMA